MQRVLITGGADGLGRALALRYIDAGHRVTILDIDQDRGATLAEMHEQITYIPFDLATFCEDVPALFSGVFDIAICNAGISASGNWVDLSSDQEHLVLEVNTFGHLRLLKALLRHRKIAPGGRLAFVLSAAVFVPFPIAPAYAASKAALDNLAYALEAYVYGSKVSVTRIYPGPMQTRHHAKYYPAFRTRGGTTPAKVATAIFRAVRRRRRRVFPDPVSKLFRLAAWILPSRLPALCYWYCKRVERMAWMPSAVEGCKKNMDDEVISSTAKRLSIQEALLEPNPTA